MTKIHLSKKEYKQLLKTKFGRKTLDALLRAGLAIQVVKHRAARFDRR